MRTQGSRHCSATITRELISGDGSSTRQYHGSTLAICGDRLLVSWFAGQHEGASDSSIWLSIRDARGRWGTPERVLGPDGVAWWNPVLSVAPNGTLCLFAHHGRAISQWETVVIESSDQGRTWSAPRAVVPGDQGGRGPVKNPAMVTPEGAWLAPASIEDGGDPAQWSAFFDRSEDDGATWNAAMVPIDRKGLRGAGVIQPTVWASGARCIALLRSSEGWAYRTVSDDDGRSWSPAEPIGLPQNNSGFCAASLSDGRVALLHNPVGDDWGARCPLSLFVSGDDGVTFTPVLDLEDGTVAPDTTGGHPLPTVESAAEQGLQPSDTGVRTSGVGEFSYPTVIRGPHRDLLVSFTWQRRGIVVASIPHELIPKR